MRNVIYTSLLWLIASCNTNEVRCKELNRAIQGLEQQIETETPKTCFIKLGPVLTTYFCDTEGRMNNYEELKQRLINYSRDYALTCDS